MNKRSKKKLKRKVRKQEYLDHFVEFVYNRILLKGIPLDFEKVEHNKHLDSKRIRIFFDRLVSKQALEK